MISIAIIEDDKLIRESLKNLIEATEGFECAGAFSDAESGLGFLTDDPADIVLMDIHLPGDGRDRMCEAVEIRSPGYAVHHVHGIPG